MGKGQYDNLVNNQSITASIAHAQITATTTGSAVTIVGGPILIGVYVSAISAADASNYQTFTITQSNDGSTYSAATAASQYVGSWDRLINATTETGWNYFQFIPSAGYYSIKVVATETATTDITFSAHVQQGEIHQPITS